MGSVSDQASMRPHSARLEALGTMTSGIAHEINSPIQFIGDNLQFISDSFDTIEQLLKRYDALRVAALDQGVLQDLTTDLTSTRSEADLDYLLEELPSAIEQSLSGIQQVARIASAMKTFAHRGSSEKERADINQAIEMTVAICRNEWKYDADLELALDSSLPKIPCHIGELSQVWLNLIVNAAHAIKAKPDLPRGLIKISTSMADGMINVEISDNGTGIPDEVREKVFEPFFSTKEAGKGSGQGLAISQNIVAKQHGGDIQITTAFGEGTAFTVRLPMESRCLEPEQHEEALA